MRNLKTIFKHFRDQTFSRKSSRDCIDRFNAAVRRHELAQRKLRRAEALDTIMDSISWLFGVTPTPAYARSYARY